MKQRSDLSQTQVQQQVQTLSPQQMLVVKLLELPTVELEERVKMEVQDNPALEEGGPEEHEESLDTYSEDEDDGSESLSDEDLSLGDYRTEDDIPDYKLQDNNASARTRPEDIPFSDATSFYENLNEQLGEQDIDDKTRELALYIIGSLDDDGFLRKDIGAVLDELEIYGGVETNISEVEKALRVVQSLDPAGIGARNLQECLLLQIRRKTNDPLKQVEERIVNECYEEFTKKHWERIPSRLGLEEDVCNKALAEIVRLNPRPGISLGESLGKNSHIIVPDFIVETSDDGEISLTLNNYNIPDLRVNRSFAEMLEDYGSKKSTLTKDEKSAMAFAKQKIDAAQGFIDALNQRRNTLLSTMQAIIDIQRPFFLEGDESLLRPMILKDVAERTGLDISTISRVSNSKYVQTNYGIYSLKFFFSDGYVTKDGEELSVREIKRILRECIDAEDKSKPLTDDELADILKQKGYPIARRTVAKYRMQLNIPVARLRK